MPRNLNVVAMESHPRAKQRGPDALSGAALDLVARLFEHLAGDPGIPEVVRVEIARLRIPTLRAVQIERDLLTNRSHPARRLLDAIAAAATGMDEAAKADDATAAEIARAVHDVLTDFDADLAPFDAMAARLGRFVEDRTRAEDAIARRIAQEIEAREREEVPERAAAREVKRRLRARLWVPAPVREMLLGSWVRALAVVHRGEGAGSQPWQELLATMDDLLWSVEPKASPEGRRRLAAMLPALIDALAQGLQRAQVDDEHCREFLSMLVDCHAHAVKSGLRGIAAIPDAPAADDDGPAALSRSTFSVGSQRVEEIRLEGTRDAAWQEAAGPQLHAGAWIELERGARAPARKRLAWTSPATGAQLFIGISATAMAVVISPAALAEQMRRGEARVIDDAPLVERALAALVAKLAPA